MVVLRMPRARTTPRTRSVRLDQEAERALADIQRLTGASISDALKRGLLAAQRELRGGNFVRPWDIYKTLDIGPGGDALGSSRTVKQDVLRILKRKHNR